MEGAKAGRPAGSGGEEGRRGRGHPTLTRSHGGQDRAFLISPSQHEAGLIVGESSGWGNEGMLGDLEGPHSRILPA